MGSTHSRKGQENGLAFHHEFRMRITMCNPMKDLRFQQEGKKNSCVSTKASLEQEKLTLIEAHSLMANEVEKEITKRNCDFLFLQRIKKICLACFSENLGVFHWETGLCADDA